MRGAIQRRSRRQNRPARFCPPFRETRRRRSWGCIKSAPCRKWHRGVEIGARVDSHTRQESARCLGAIWPPICANAGIGPPEVEILEGSLSRPRYRGARMLRHQAVHRAKWPRGVLRAWCGAIPSPISRACCSRRARSAIALSIEQGPAVVAARNPSAVLGRARLRAAAGESHCARWARLENPGLSASPEESGAAWCAASALGSRSRNEDTVKRAGKCSGVWRAGRVWKVSVVAIRGASGRACPAYPRCEVKLLCEAERSSRRGWSRRPPRVAESKAAGSTGRWA